EKILGASVVARRDTERAEVQARRPLDPAVAERLANGLSVLPGGKRFHRLPGYPEAMALIDGQLREPPLVAECPHQALGFAEAAEDSIEFTEWEECRAKAKAQIDGLLLSFASLRQTLKRRQRLLEGAHRLPVGRSGQGLVAGLTEVRGRLLPQLTPHRMVSQPLDVLRQSVGIRTRAGADDPRVQGLAPLVQQ